MKLVDGVPMIGLLLKRLSQSARVDKIVVAIPETPDNDALAEYVAGTGHAVYRGSDGDVLDRYYQASRNLQADVVVRVTGDCPLVDPGLVDEVIGAFLEESVDYSCNTSPPSFPDGLDVEAFSFRALQRAWVEALAPYEREHVTPYLREGGRFKSANVHSETDESSRRWTVDEPEDLEVIRRVFGYFAPRRDFSWREVLDLERERPEWFEGNQRFRRNEGAAIKTGQKLWRRARRVIPGGNMFLSKRAEMFLPEQWPAYFSRANGCTVWDLDGREYTDVSLMGVGTNVLGYGHPEVDDAVRAAVSAGNMSTLNCPEEVLLAERLVEMHPWAGMVRLARTGGEANAVAIRIARAATGREKVAVCGYHGWHDWYLAANLGGAETLAGHLLPGLEPRGVPEGLQGTVLPFEYNDLAALERVLSTNDVGVIKMEVSRNVSPAPGFLEAVRRLATERGAVLIFDECSSGFRQTFGGLHKQYGVEPDMAVFGKTLGNGYAITAVIGRRAVMESAQSTFISSTFWTERIGPAAALKTLEVMERTRSWEVITSIGTRIGQGWLDLGRRHGLTLKLSGLPAMVSFSVESPDMLKYKTLITQEMLKRGFLATNTVYTCAEHTDGVLARYFEALDPVLGLIGECESGRSVDELLEGPVCHSGFKRLN